MTRTETAVRIEHPGAAATDGDLVVPDEPTGLVVFAHGSRSGRYSPRNRQVAAGLQERGLATLLLDLLTAEEQVDVRTRELRFDIGLLAQRLAGAADWLRDQPHLASLTIGYFGASTGGGAALVAAAIHPDRIGAVVSRGGRPDLAGDYLARVEAPTLLIVGGADPVVLDLNEQALKRLRTESRLEVVPKATHLFEEPGALEEVTRLAGNWLCRQLG